MNLCRLLIGTRDIDRLGDPKRDAWRINSYRLYWAETQMLVQVS